jgi:hypothetical protein
MGSNGVARTLARGPDRRNGAARKAGMPSALGGMGTAWTGGAGACPSFALMRG